MLKSCLDERLLDLRRAISDLLMVSSIALGALSSCHGPIVKQPEVELVEEEAKQEAILIETIPVQKIEEEGREEEEAEKVEEAFKGLRPLNPLPRVVIALWDSQYEERVEFTSAHMCAEMPLNFLGVKVEYVDLQRPLPSLVDRSDVIGILSWLPASYVLKDPIGLIRWLLHSIDVDKKFVQIGDFDFDEGEKGMSLRNGLWQRLGIYSLENWASLTYNFELIYAASSLFHFEGDIPLPLPEFIKLKIVDPDARSLLAVRNKNYPEEEYAIGVMNEKGAFISEKYLLYNVFSSGQIYKKWFVNPFRFFQLAFSIEEMPIPDPSTVAGRRAYFSHIDGDGWNNVSYVVDSKRGDPILSSKLILESVIDANPDLPVTIGPIAANLNLEWNGTENAQEIARKCLSRPQVEVGCHTYTHPFNWAFFENYTPEKESIYLSRYPGKTWQNGNWFDLGKLLETQETFYRVEDVKDRRGQKEPKTVSEQFEQHYFTPRAYALKPFDSEFEILGAIHEIDEFAPKDKPARVYQWSGNALPWADLIEMTEKAGLENINGGDPRFDFTFPSYSYVCSLARRLGSDIQVYTCASNENLYTDLWTKNFYGLATLPTTFERTESPIRVKAMNLYYHMYSGERIPSLYAIFRNLSFIRSQKIAPIPTSLYCASVDGFFSSEIVPLGEMEWIIKNRNALQTFRVDRAVFRGVDWKRSQGVIGQRHFQGSLYIYLDEVIENPVIALEQMEEGFQEPDANRPYLIESSWRVFHFLHPNPEVFTYESNGFGAGEFRWKVPLDGIYEVKLHDGRGEIVEALEASSLNRELSWTFKMSFLGPSRVEVRLKSAQEAISDGAT